MFNHAAVAYLAALLAISTVEADSLRRQLADGATYSNTDQSWQPLMLAKVNAARAEKGLQALCLNSILMKVAQAHSEDMAAQNYYEHEGLDGSEPIDRAMAAGFGTTYVSENIMAGVADIESAMDSWLHSSGHYANIMDTKSIFAGFGYGYDANSEWKHYWTQNFGWSETESCDVDGGSSASNSTTSAASDDSSVANEAETTTTPALTEPATLAPSTDASSESAADEVDTTEAPVEDSSASVDTATSSGDEPAMPVGSYAESSDASAVADSANGSAPDVTDASEATSDAFDFGEASTVEDASDAFDFGEGSEVDAASDATDNEPSFGDASDATMPSRGYKRRN